MIQKFLINNLIQITEDENVEKLTKASSLLEKKLNKNKHKIPIFTLIALDPEIQVTEPNVMEVQQMIIDNWKTFTSNCKDTPIVYIRAVIFEALTNLSKDIDLANQIWLSSRNIQKYYKLKGKEKELITEFLTNLGNEIETVAADKWALSSEMNFQKLSIEIKELTGVKLDNAKIEAHFKAASIHSGWGNGGENPHHQGQNNQNWPIFMSERFSNGLTTEINNVLSTQVKEIRSSQTQIQEAINKLLTQILTKLAEQNGTMQIRTQLLWWKEACYSLSLRDTYREQPNGLLQLILAYDYASFVPFIYPASVDYFLKETHRGIIADNDKKMTLSEIFKLLDSSKDTLKQVIKESTFEDERISLLDFVTGYIWGKFSIKQLKNTVGIPEATELTLTAFTLWLYHDLQVLKTIKNK